MKSTISILNALLIASTMAGFTVAAPGGTRKLDDSACAGMVYYKYLDVNGTWADAYESTTSGCILSPVKDSKELLEILAVIPDRTTAWVGIYKDINDVRDDNGGHGSIDHWYNMDKTPIAVLPQDSPTGWAGPEPNNFELYAPETRGFVRKGDESYGPGLYDGGLTLKRDGAVYKCCALQTSLTCEDSDRK